MWREVRFGDIANIAPSNVDKKSVVGEAQVRLCNYMDVYNNRFVTNSLDYMVATASAAEIAKFSLIPSDVIFTKDSETPEDIAVASIVAEELENVVCGYHLAIARPKDEVDGTFLMYRLWEDEVHKQFFRVANGSTRYGLTIGAISDVHFTIPDVPYQEKISEVLIAADATIKNTEALIAKYEQIKQGMMQDLLTRGVDENGQLRPSYEEAPHLYKESELGWLPKEWGVSRLDEVASVDRGKFTHRPRDDERMYGGPYPFIQTSNITTAVGLFVKQYSQTLSQAGKRVSKEFPKNTIAVTIAANIADTAILAIPMCFPDSVVGVQVHSPNQIAFIELCIRMNKRMLNALAPQSAQKNINLEDLRPLKIPLPGPSEQFRISSKYEHIGVLILLERIALEKLRQQKIGLMQDLLTGKVRVSLDREERAEAVA